jgi:hypothetical protein
VGPDDVIRTVGDADLANRHNLDPRGAFGVPS